MKTSALQIKTAEGVVFSQLLAGPVTRFMAWLIDAMCISAAITILGYVLGFLGLISADIAGALGALAYFVLSIGYGMAFEWAWRGQTVGKRLFRLRVVDVEGMKLQFNQVAVRNLLRFVDSLPAFYFLGGLTCWFNSKSQRLGDIAANTIVVRNPRVTEPDLDQLLAGKYNSLRQYPHLAARLRQRVSPQEAAITLAALMRRDELDLVARVDLFAELAAHFREKVAFPDDASDGVTDEQYVRNVVDVVCRASEQSRR